MLVVPKPRPIRARRRRPPSMALYAGLVVAAGSLLTIAATRPASDPASAGGASAGAPGVIDGIVTRVIDGDTFEMTGAGVSIRVWGLDAPERNEAGGAQATEALARIASGQRLSCEKMDTDKYGRIVGRCRLANGEDIAALMIESGAAREYLRYSGGYYRDRRP